VTQANPFDYGGPVAGDRFTGRRRELAALTARLRDHIGVVITAPRRYGKSSLIEQATRELAATRPRPAIVRANLLQAGSLHSAAAVLTRALYGVPGGAWQGVKETVAAFVRRLRVSPTVTFDPSGQPSFSFSPQLSPADVEVVIGDLYATLDEVGATRPAVLVLDEFQAVNELSPNLAPHLKALADAHRHVSLVVAGSKQHLMEALVLSRGAPLYDMLQTIALGPIELEDWLPFLLERAAGGGRPFAGDEVAEAVWARAKPVPFDVQQLAYECFNQATRQIDHGVVERAVDELIGHEANSYAVTFEGLSPGQRRVLRALADGAGGSPGSSEFASAAGLADATSVRKALHVLADRELVVRRPGTGWRVDDPFFAAWVRRGGSGS
jgi:hypothetical protein